MIIWKNTWTQFDLPDKEAYFLGEMNWELEGNENHPLQGRTFRITGWIQGYDDFLLQDTVTDKYVYVRLTWKKETDPRWPHSEPIGDEKQLNSFIAKWNES